MDILTGASKINTALKGMNTDDRIAVLEFALESAKRERRGSDVIAAPAESGPLASN